MSESALRIQFPISEVAELGTGNVVLERESLSVWLRLGYSDGEKMPEHWRAARLSVNAARQLGDALLSFAHQISAGS